MKPPAEFGIRLNGVEPKGRVIHPFKLYAVIVPSDGGALKHGLAELP